MKPIIIDSEITFIPYYPDPDTALPWYQDLDVCRQVDNIDFPYSLERLQKMYTFLSTHGDCFYIQYRGVLVGDVTLRNDQEVCIVVCKDYQNKRIGRRCILKMIELAKEKGMDQITAEIYPFNTQSQKMFLSIGFVKTGEETYTYQLS